eukprot:3382724-Prymnesium_polylepis.1
MRRGGFDGADRFSKHHAAHGALLRVALERSGHRLVQVPVDEILRRLRAIARRVRWAANARDREKDAVARQGLHAPC